MKSNLGWAVAGLALFATACDKKSATNAPAASATSAATAAAPAGTDWTETVSETPDGGFRMGNPDAAVKLVEYASLTCPHCAEFAKEANAPLKSGFVKSGKVSWEYRPFLLNPVDVAASLIVRCQPNGPVLKLIEQTYAEQQNWYAKFMTIPEAEQKRIAALPDDAQRISALAKAGELDKFYAARGIPEAKIDACLADKAGLAKLVSIQETATKKGVNGTPTFFINDENIGSLDANGLLAKLRTSVAG